MEDLHCPSCGEEYDTKTKLPRLFPNCGHTFCSTCIQEMIVNSEDSLSCPEDNIECQFFNKEVGIGCFPLNFALHRFLAQKNSRRGTTTMDRIDRNNREDEATNLNYCSDHSKVCEIICLTDRKIICTDCALFGVHKNHHYTRMDDFKKDVKSKLTTLENKTDAIKYKAFLSNSDKQVGLLREKVHHKKQQLMNVIRENINSMIEEVKLKERDLEEDLESRFSKFNYALGVIDSTAKKLKDRQLNIERTLNKIKTQIKKREFDYGFLMTSLYSENNVFASLKELIDEIAQLESSSGEVVDRELEKYVIEGNVGQVVKLIHDCMEIKCFDDNSDEKSPEHKTKNNFDEDTDRKTHILTPKRERKPINIDIVEDNRLSPLVSGHVMRQNTRVPYKDESISINKSNNDMSRSGINLNKGESVSLIDVHIEDMNSELMDDKNSNDNSMNDQSLSNIHSTSLVSKNQGLKKNASFFKKSSQSKIPEPPNAYYIPEVIGTRAGYDQTYQVNNPIILTDSYRNPETPHTFYQKTLNNDKYTDQRNRFLVGQAREKQSSWTDQDNINLTSKLAKSPVRRPTLTNRFNTISTRQIPLESDTEIDFSRMNINDHAVPQIITELLKKKKVKAINLSHNSITEIGFEQLLKKLSTHPSLERIYMLNNYLDDSVFVKLEQWSKKLKKINYFNFQNCSHFKNIVKIKKYVNSLSKCGIKIDI